jgi:2-oxo-4-hydroxy-4-carboxy-5-ureidoimidazoline decarboxylase
MAGGRPYVDELQLLKAAQAHWNGLGREDWLEAFARHPRIGDKAALRAKLASSWAAGEQAGARSAPEETLDALAEGNAAYERRFGHVFLICATGKSAEEMLAALRRRLESSPAAELQAAAGEQAKITELRLKKLLSPEAS